MESLCWSTELHKETRLPFTSIMRKTNFPRARREVRYRVGDHEHLARAGATLLAPKGIPHTYRVVSPKARMLTITRHGFESFIRAIGRPAEREDLPEPSGPLTPEQAEALAQTSLRFGIELIGPPLS